MNRPTLQHCQDRITTFAAAEMPEEWTTSVDPVKVGDATLTALTIFWEGRDANAVPREARLFFGLDNKLLFAQGLDPGAFMYSVEEGFDVEMADKMATRRLASFEDVFPYLKGERYHLADRA